ncbi:hypothetical protein EDB81DRAFT_459444 [Dactylonectria macrodidyma]|uniref:Uncharacterized protein n=1 Tax=Dactylonectria macrodidyma TaxID=307937 RepID=A0A9P9EXE9_9HYPO|nr:hypothetical protein EDB81DRAFT_459444 [Dactylonectria macrodidyma]
MSHADVQPRTPRWPQCRQLCRREMQQHRMRSLPHPAMSTRASPVTFWQAGTLLCSIYSTSTAMLGLRRMRCRHTAPDPEPPDLSRRVDWFSARSCRNPMERLDQQWPLSSRIDGQAQKKKKELNSTAVNRMNLQSACLHGLLTLLIFSPPFPTAAYPVTRTSLWRTALSSRVKPGVTLLQDMDMDSTLLPSRPRTFRPTRISAKVRGRKESGSRRYGVRKCLRNLMRPFPPVE